MKCFEYFVKHYFFFSTLASLDICMCCSARGRIIASAHTKLQDLFSHCCKRCLYPVREAVMTNSPTKRGLFSSSFGVLSATLGSSVGLGNMWSSRPSPSPMSAPAFY